jgi:hypothetical protein
VRRYRFGAWREAPISPSLSREGGRARRVTAASLGPQPGSSGPGLFFWVRDSRGRAALFGGGSRKIGRHHHVAAPGGSSEAATTLSVTSVFTLCALWPEILGPYGAGWPRAGGSASQVITGASTPGHTAMAPTPGGPVALATAIPVVRSSLTRPFVPSPRAPYTERASALRAKARTGPGRVASVSTRCADRTTRRSCRSPDINRESGGYEEALATRTYRHRIERCQRHAVEVEQPAR